MQQSANGGDIQNVAAFRNALQLGSAALASMGTGKGQVLSASHFTFFAGGNGYLYIPCLATTDNPVKIMLQWEPFRHAAGKILLTRRTRFHRRIVGYGMQGNVGLQPVNERTRIANRSQISIQNWAPAGAVEDCCFFAVGYL